METSHMRRTDADLMRRARSDPGAFRDIYDRYAAAINAFHLRQSRDRDVAHDLTAETFAQAWEHRARFTDRSAGSAAPWLYGIARHVLLRSVRTRRLERAACQRLGILEALDRVPATAEPIDEWLDGVDAVLETLSADQRAAIREHVLEDVPYDVAAVRLSTTPEVVRARVSRGLRSLRGRMLVKGDSR